MSMYKRLDVWNEAHQLTMEIYKTTIAFPSEEKFGITSQIRRAAVSVPTNIAEGQGRSNNKEFINFLRISKGSASEVEYLIFLSYELGYLDRQIYFSLLDKTQKILAMLNSLITSLQNYQKNK